MTIPNRGDVQHENMVGNNAVGLGNLATHRDPHFRNVSRRTEDGSVCLPRPPYPLLGCQRMSLWPFVSKKKYQQAVRDRDVLAEQLVDSRKVTDEQVESVVLAIQDAAERIVYAVKGIPS